MADRVRIQNVGLSTVLLGQGVPFMHAGSDLLRSKSLDRDSFNSGDWFNKLDFTYQDNNFGAGLPVASKNQENWSIMAPLLANPALKPAAADIGFSAALYQELLQIRYSSMLFRLQTADEIQARVLFHNTGPAQLPGLIAMSIADNVGVDLDPRHEAIYVLINANDETQTIMIDELTGVKMSLHPVQMASVDPVVKTAAYDETTGAFTVPGRTTAVFVELAPAQERIGYLIEDVESLVAQGVLNNGQGNSLIAKLEDAIKKLSAGQPKTAVNRLNAFINEVMSLIAEGTLTPEQGQPLIDVAADIIWQIQTGF
jgi:pullulanase/glycogen debranching enzyme